MVAGSNRKRSRPEIRTGLRPLWRRASMTAAATKREKREGRATPATPMPKPYTRTALPATLRAFIRMETYMEARELPMARSRAAQPLYRAMKG